MTSERWRQVEDLFHSALDRAPDDRAAFLDGVCADDRALRRQVEDLLESFGEAGDFIEKPLVEDSLPSRVKGFTPPESIIGRKIGNYEILSLLGAGGMGEVYLARDVRLGRQIALKILPAQFTQDPAQVERFEREARAASALNHPNIITIHDIGEEGDRHFIATEFIEGRTLREIITHGAHGKAGLRESLALAVQIAGALAAAHAAGIVHRDIKPENVMVRSDGLVKLLDFGLAKPVGDGREWGVGSGEWGKRKSGPLLSSHSPLPTPHSLPSQMTDPRMLMGTLAYLSPEQARGEKVDHRTDVFSLGVALYEMIAGNRPFQGGSSSAALDAILNQEPEPIAIGKFSPELNRVISRALEKDRQARYQNANDLRDDLRRLEQRLEADAATAQSRHPRRLLKMAAMVLVGVAVLAGAWRAWWRKSDEPKEISSPWMEAVPVSLTGFPGAEFSPSLAPDGQSFVYERTINHQRDIFIQRVGDAQARNLTADSPADDWMAAFSPDGARIAFRSQRNGGGLFVMNADGTNTRLLSQEGFNPAWAPDGQEIVYGTGEGRSPYSRGPAGSQLWVINVATGARRRIPTGDAVQPSWSPSGARIAYWGLRSSQRDLWTVAVSGGEPVEVTNDKATDWSPVWSADGKYLYFASDIKGGVMRFWRAPIDEMTGRVLGAREAVTGPTSDSWSPSLSRDGRRMAYVDYVIKENVYRVDFDTKQGRTVGEPIPLTHGERRVTAPDVSADGQWVAYYSFGGPQEDLFVVRRDGTAPRRLTNDEYKDRVPRWSPDGRSIAFYSDRSGNHEIWAINEHGGDLRQITQCRANCLYPTWSPDGLRMAFYRQGVNTLIIETGKSWEEQTPAALPLPKDGGHFEPWSWSPDGSMMAGIWRAPSGQNAGVCVYSLITGQYEQITNRGSDPTWLSDNRRLLFTSKDQLFLVDIRSKQDRVISPFESQNIRLAMLSRDNIQLYFTVISAESDIRLLTLN